MFRVKDHIVHYGHFSRDGKIEDRKIVCEVDMKRRLNLNRNHTATHLINRILREILNDSNLIQKASLIHDDHFIFEYSTINTNTSKKIFEELERRVNHSD